jgi:hypothetical protein
MIVFSLNIVKEREKNLNTIVSNIISQCDQLYVNLINFSLTPEILLQNKVIVNHFFKGGSELRFFNYNDCEDDTYFFTIDDDIIYPLDYAEKHMEKIKKYNNKIVTCIHGSNVNLNQNMDFYQKGREVYRFQKSLTADTPVMIPGVGTSCFYKKSIKINLEDFKTPNMSDVYIASFLFKQKISIISIKRDDMWLKPIPTNDKTIWRNNPYEEIDIMINKTFKEKV